MHKTWRTELRNKDLYIVRCLLLKYRLIFLRVLKVFDEPLGKSNTERRVKRLAGISKKASNNIFIVKFKTFTPGVKMLEFNSNRKN